MSAQGPGRKRIPNRDKLSAEDDALNEIVREAEARLAAKRAARAEARDIRMKELEKREKELFHSHKEDSERYSRHSRRLTSVSDDEEKMSVGSRGSFRPSDYSSFLSSSSRASSRASSARASPVVEERPDRDFLDKGSRTASTLSAATLASLGGAASRRGSCDTSLSVETEASIREMKDSLVEAEEKYRKAMVSNAQLHNEKTALMYQVETLREELNDIEELLWEARRQCDMTTKEFERERQAHVFLQFHFKEMKETMRQSDELLTEVSELRVRSRTHCQEVCDLQETLQWKDKRIVALERQKEISDVVCIQRDQLRNEVRQLRDLLKKHGIVLPDITPNGESEKCMAEDDITDEPGSRLAQETSHGGRENILGKAPTQHPADDAKYETKGATRRIFKHSQSVNEITSSGRERWSADSQNQEEHGRPSRDETDDENKINKMMTQMSLDVFNEEKNEDCEGQSPEVGDLSKGNMEKSAGFLSPQSPSKDKDFTFSYSDVCDEPKSSEHNPCLPVEGNTVRERRSLRKEVKNQMIPLVHKTNPNVSFENLNQPPRSSVSPFVHKEAMKDWTGVETMIQSILRWILQNQSFVEELKASLNWILEGEDVEKNTEAKVLDPADQIKPLADGGQTGSVSAVMDELVSADASGSGSRAKTILHLKKRDDRGAAGRTSVVTLRTPASNQQETLVENEDDQSNDDHDLTTCCCQDFVFVELYFAEPFESRAEDCGSDQDSVDLEVKPDKPAGGLKKEKTKCYLHHRSNVRSFSEEETVVKRVETVTKDTDQVFPVKNRKMKNNCVIL